MGKTLTNIGAIRDVYICNELIVFAFQVPKAAKPTKPAAPKMKQKGAGGKR